MSSEIERKFLLGELPDWLADRPGQAISQGYLDNGKGAEIRLRRVDGRRLMTVKTGAGEVRDEVEVEIGAGLFERLWPLTEGRRVAKRRRRHPLGNGLSAEVDVYEGELAGLTVVEVEFGSPERSHGFSPPDWLGEEITGERGYSNRELATCGAPAGAHDAARKRPSRAYRLKRKEEVGAGLRRVAHGRIEKAVASLREVEDDPAGAIHSARKDIKKARAALRLVRDQLGGKRYKAENRRLRDAGQALSGSRDATVKLETLSTLEQHFGHEYPSASAATWERQLEADRDALAARGADSDAVAAAIEVLEAARGAAGSWPLDGDSWKLIGPGLRRAYSHGREAMAAVAADPDPELVHEWRKRAKDLWYQLRLLRKTWPEPLGATVDQVHELTDRLGDHHDLTVLAADLGGRAEIGSRALLGELIERRQRELLDEALALGARIYAERPKAFGRRIRAYWSAWR